MYKIAAHLQELKFNHNNIAVVEVAEKKICIAKLNHALTAFAYKCPHASGVLAEGYLDASGNIVCPVHGYRFDTCHGRNTSGEGYHLKIYQIEKREDGWYINID